MKDTTYFQNSCQECHGVTFHSILEVGAKPHPQLFHSGVGWPSPDREFVVLLDNIDKSCIFHPLLGAIRGPVRLADSVASLEDQVTPSTKWMVGCDSAVLRTGIWANFVVFKPTSWFQTPCCEVQRPFSGPGMDILLECFPVYCRPVGKAA